MGADRTAERPPATGPCVLLVDDDRRILELLEIAFSAHGFRVTTAPDGDAAMKRMLAEHPDLVVLDVRLPRKSGLEVCEWLRRDPDDPGVPIIMVSAVVDTETRLQAFARGADDYLTKPFSPKELIARVKRLLARSAEARAARAHERELEREAAHAREETQRAHAATLREQRLRDLALGQGLDLLALCDEDELARRILPLFRARVGTGLAGLLLADPRDGALAPAAVRGDGLDRLAALKLPVAGALASLLAGLERPVLRHDLERFPDLAGEVALLVAEGVALLVPLRGPDGLVGLLVLDERRDGAPFAVSELESLETLARFAGVALHNALRGRALAERLLEERAARRGPGEPVSPALAEAESLADRAARATLVPPRRRSALSHAVRTGGVVAGTEAAALVSVATDDPSGFVREVALLLSRTAAPAPAAAPEEARLVALLVMAWEYAAERARGADTAAALSAAIERAGGALDPTTAQALHAALRERTLATLEAAS
jgi:DNA-binding response OmpR family regulator